MLPPVLEILLVLHDHLLREHLPTVESLDCKQERVQILEILKRYVELPQLVQHLI